MFGLMCITDHPGFNPNINPYVIENAYYRYIEVNGPVGEYTLMHKLYRHLCYRSITQWFYVKLGKKNRKVLPSCVVNAIRQNFPSEDKEYTGFKYASKF